MNNTEVLEIHKNFWEDFKELYKVDWPKNINGHYTVDTFIKWFRKNPNLNVKVYGLEAGWNFCDYRKKKFLREKLS